MLVAPSVNYSPYHSFFRMSALPLTGLVLALGFFTGCAPTVNLATPKPIEDLIVPSRGRPASVTPRCRA